MRRSQTIECNRRLNFLYRRAKILPVAALQPTSSINSMAKTSQLGPLRQLPSFCWPTHPSSRSSRRNLLQLFQTQQRVQHLRSLSSCHTSRLSFKKGYACIPRLPCACNASLQTTLFSTMILQRSKTGSSQPVPLLAWTLFPCR